jgi:hypothetical protein
MNEPTEADHQSLARRVHDVADTLLTVSLDRDGIFSRFVKSRGDASARFFGVPFDWKNERAALESRFRPLAADLELLEIQARADDASLCPVVKRLQESLGGLVTAVLEVETKKPASELWRQCQDEVLESIRRLEGGDASSATCPVCGEAQFDQVYRLRVHFQEWHPKPGASEMQLFSVAEQLSRIEEAQRAVSDAFIDVKQQLRECWPDLAGNQAGPASVPRKRGATQSLWKQPILNYAQKRRQSGTSQPRPIDEARALIDLVMKSNEYKSLGKRPEDQTVAGWLRRIIPQGG